VFFDAPDHVGTTSAATRSYAPQIADVVKITPMSASPSYVGVAG
jgi:hypothetical protein